MLGPESYGVYAFSLSVAMLLAVPAHMGLPTLVVREVAVARATRQWGVMRGVLSWGNRVALLMGGCVAAGAAFTVWILLPESEGRRLATLISAFALVPLISLASVRTGTLRGLDRIISGQLPERIIRPAVLLLLLYVAWLGGDLRTDTAMQLHVLAAAVALGAGIWLLRRSLPEQVRCAEPRTMTKEWMFSLWPLALLAGIQTLNTHTDLIMVGLLAGSEAAGIYSVAVQVAAVVVFMLTVVNLAIAPHFARWHANKERAQLQNAATWAANLSIVSALPIAAGLIVFGEPLLDSVFGEAYSAGHRALAILCVGQTLNAMAGPVILLLNMAGYERDTVRGVAAAAVANIVLNALLIPHFGIEGAAFATASSIVLWNAILGVTVYRRIGIISMPLLPRYLRLRLSGEA